MPQNEPSHPEPSKLTILSHYFTTPKPIKRLFNKFPLVIYPANQLPRQTSHARNRHALYVFSGEHIQLSGGASYNPSCLKWQTYFKFAGIDFVTVSSTNHASPTGSLPFLIPASSNPSPSNESVIPIPSNKLQEWAVEHGSRPLQEPSNIRHDAYKSLVDNQLRKAWLYHLYLSPQNFASVAHPLYITPLTTSPVVRMNLSHSLRSAALSEILKQSVSYKADPELLCIESDRAFSALSELLGADEWFFGGTNPSLFDASVFAYTHLLLDLGIGWHNSGGGEKHGVGKALKDGKWQNLIDHRNRIYKGYY